MRRSRPNSRIRRYCRRHTHSRLSPTPMHMGCPMRDRPPTTRRCLPQRRRESRSLSSGFLRPPRRSRLGFSTLRHRSSIRRRPRSMNRCLRQHPASCMVASLHRAPSAVVSTGASSMGVCYCRHQHQQGAPRTLLPPRPGRPSPLHHLLRGQQPKKPLWSPHRQSSTSWSS